MPAPAMGHKAWSQRKAERIAASSDPLFAERMFKAAVATGILKPPEEVKET